MKASKRSRTNQIYNNDNNYDEKWRNVNIIPLTKKIIPYLSFNTPTIAAAAAVAPSKPPLPKPRALCNIPAIKAPSNLYFELTIENEENGNIELPNVIKKKLLPPKPPSSSNNASTIKNSTTTSEENYSNIPIKPLLCSNIPAESSKTKPKDDCCRSRKIIPYLSFPCNVFNDPKQSSKPLPRSNIPVESVPSKLPIDNVEMSKVNVKQRQDDEEWRNIGLKNPRVFIPYLSFPRNVFCDPKPPQKLLPRSNIPIESVPSKLPINNVEMPKVNVKQRQADDKNDEEWRNFGLKNPRVFIPYLCFYKPPKPILNPRKSSTLKKAKISKGKQRSRSTPKMPMTKPSSTPPRKSMPSSTIPKPLNPPKRKEKQILADISHPKYKTVPCRRMETGKWCYFGDQCNFLHPGEIPTSIFKKLPSKKF